MATMAEPLTADALAGAIRERLQATHVVRRAPDAQDIVSGDGPARRERHLVPRWARPSPRQRICRC